MPGLIGFQDCKTNACITYFSTLHVHVEHRCTYIYVYPLLQRNLTSKWLLVTAYIHVYHNYMINLFAFVLVEDQLLISVDFSSKIPKSSKSLKKRSSLISCKCMTKLHAYVCVVYMFVLLCSTFIVFLHFFSIIQFTVVCYHHNNKHETGKNMHCYIYTLLVQVLSCM